MRGTTQKTHPKNRMCFLFYSQWARSGAEVRESSPVTATTKETLNVVAVGDNGYGQSNVADWKNIKVN